MITPPKHTLNQIAAAWQEQIRAAADQPWLFNLLMRQWARLFRRFARFYQQLLALPRPHKRALKRTLATTLAGAALLLALGQALPAHAATITVDGVTCTLAEAIDSANNDNAGGNGCVEGSGADMIDLQTDVTLSTLLPQITSEITLEGNGHTLDGNNSFQVLNVQASGNLTLNDATITGGGPFGNDGGGIRNHGTLTVNDSTLSSNSALHGGGIYNYGGGTVNVNNSALSDNAALDGGGIFNKGALTVNNSTLSGNFAGDGDGGGILNFSGGTLTVNNSTLSGNGAYSGSGGGIWNNGTLTVNNSTLTLNGNSATSFGGGIFSPSGTVMLNNSTLSGNSAYLGGGINSGGTLTVNNSTLSGNTADLSGGGIGNWGMLTVNHSTLSGNYAANYFGGGINNYYYGTVNLNHSLISGNAVPSGAEVYNNNSGVVSANSYNVVGYGGSARSVGFTPGPNDIIPPGALDAVLDTILADNGGHTFTHALVSASVAIDAAPDAPCLAPPINGVDQRGFPRNVDGDSNPSSNECDTGAFEFAPSGRPTKTPTPTEMPRPTRTPTPRPTRTPTPTLIAAQQSALVSPAANPLINIVVVTLLALGNLLFFHKGRS